MKYSRAVALAAVLVTLAPVCMSNGAYGYIDLIQSYPLIQEENFNNVTLTCKNRNSSVATCEEDIAFYLNGTNISELLNVSDCYNGIINFNISQSTEGNFTCALNGTQSNPVALAGMYTFYWLSVL